MHRDHNASPTKARVSLWGKQKKIGRFVPEFVVNVNALWLGRCGGLQESLVGSYSTQCMIDWNALDTPVGSHFANQPLTW